MIKQFGSKVSKEDIKRFGRSKHWDGKKFINLEKTGMSVKLSTIPKLLYRQIFKTAGKRPETFLPIMPFNKEKFLSPSDKTKFIWYGH